MSIVAYECFYYGLHCLMGAWGRGDAAACRPKAQSWKHAHWGCKNLVLA